MPTRPTFYFADRGTNSSECGEMKTLPFICPNSLFGKAVIVSLVYNTQKYNELRVKKPISRCEFETCFGYHPTKASVEAGKGYLLFVG